tara:strand:+ start:2527 stop:2847 length:321 start_codon:yes stop_codon:yes gene_type:complete
MKNNEAYKMFRTTDPQTSVDAAKSLNPTRLESLVLEAIRQREDFGCTMDEVESLLPKVRASSISPRFKPLMEKGYVVGDGRTRKAIFSNKQQRILWAKEFYKPEKD